MWQYTISLYLFASHIVVCIAMLYRAMNAAVIVFLLALLSSRLFNGKPTACNVIRSLLFLIVFYSIVPCQARINKQILRYDNFCCRFNTNKDSYLSLDELKRMMEVLGAPQTHLGLKGMIAEVDEDGDGRLSFREFLLVYRKARAGELDADSGLGQLAKLTEVDVDKVGVVGAKEFFEAKVSSHDILIRNNLILVRLIKW